MTNADRLTMPIGEAMFTQRSVRRLKPDPIPVDDLQLILDAAVRAPNGGNHQVARFLACGFAGQGKGLAPVRVAVRPAIGKCLCRTARNIRRAATDGVHGARGSNLSPYSHRRESVRSFRGLARSLHPRWP